MSIKEKINRKRAKLLADCTCMALDMKSSAEKTMSPGTLALAGSAGMVMSSVMAVAGTGSEVQKKIGNALETIFKVLLGISTGLAVTMAAYHFICCIFGNAKKTEMHIDAVNKIAVIWIVLNSLGLIVNFVYPLVSKGGFAGNQSSQNSFS